MMPNYNLYEDAYDAFLEGRWVPRTEGTEVDGKWTVTVHDNHGRSVSHSDTSMSEAHNRAMDKVRDAISQGQFLP